MLGFTAAELIVVGIAAAGVGATVYGADKARSASNKAMDQQKAQAAITAKAAEQATNKANAKSPDSSAMLSANMQAGQAGQGSTMLTGPQGVDPSTLTLGKTTLLGG
jgi:hypothetical protein